MSPTYKRWYDHDPLLLEVVELLRNYQDELKTHAEVFLLKIEEKVSKEAIDKFDVSGMETLYLLAKDLLLENYQNVLEELEEVFDERITVDCVECWPIFADFRKTEEYTKFVEKHSSDFLDFKTALDSADETSPSKNKTVTE